LYLLLLHYQPPSLLVLHSAAAAAAAAEGDIVVEQLLVRSITIHSWQQSASATRQMASCGCSQLQTPPTNR
jgi:hypothetical protein